VHRPWLTALIFEPIPKKAALNALL